MTANSNGKLAQIYAKLIHKKALQLYESVGKDDTNVSCTAAFSHMELNRYTNILPYDHSRVKLLTKQDNDYINASMVPDPFNGNRKFIAAQGPLRSTVKDFWLMILENNVEFIVVVANLEESGREKCYKYWPDLNCTLELSADLKVLNLSEEIVNRGDLAIRKFRLKNRTVTMLHFIGWPDHDVPSSEQIPALLKINDIISLTTSPVVVHCSAGVGRTGTFITINCCLNLLKNNDVGERDVVYECLAQIRKYRMRLVETFAQYMFCYQVVLSQLKSNNK